MGTGDKILATIFYISKAYSLVYPEKSIFIRGRNTATTRLYRAAINHTYFDFITDFFISGGIYVENKINTNLNRLYEINHTMHFYSKEGKTLFASRISCSLYLSGINSSPENLSRSWLTVIPVKSIVLAFFTVISSQATSVITAAPSFLCCRPCSLSFNKYNA